MFKQLSYYILFSVITLLCIQCQSDNTTTEKAPEATIKSVEVAQLPESKEEATSVEKTAIPIEAIQKTEAKPLAVKEPIKVETVKVETPKKVAAKTAEAADRKKEPTAPKKKKKKRPAMKFDETTFKFGTIKQGDKIDHKFKFKNTGSAPLVIKTVDVSCGCTFPSYPFMPIEPGKEGIIEVTFNSEHKIGRQKPTVTVVTNARPRTVKLYLEGFVE